MSGYRNVFHGLNVLIVSQYLYCNYTEFVTKKHGRGEEDRALEVGNHEIKILKKL